MVESCVIDQESSILIDDSSLCECAARLGLPQKVGLWRRGAMDTPCGTDMKGFHRLKPSGVEQRSRREERTIGERRRDEETGEQEL